MIKLRKRGKKGKFLGCQLLHHHPPILHAPGFNMHSLVLAVHLTFKAHVRLSLVSSLQPKSECHVDVVQAN